MKLFIIMFVKSICTPSHIVQCYLPWTYAVAICHWNLPQLFAVRTCHGNLPQLFAVAICREYLSWLFAVGLFFVCKQTFFLCEWIFFLCKRTFLNWKQTFFIWEQNFFSFMRISFLTVFLFVFAVAVMGHRISLWILWNVLQHFSWRTPPVTASDG